MKKNILAVAAVILVLVMALAACGNGGGTEGGETTTTAAPTTTTQPAGGTDPATTTQPPTTRPIPDLGGITIRFGSQAIGGSIPTSGFNPETGEWTVHEDPLGIGYWRAANRMRVEEMFNFTFEPVHIPGGEFLERLGTAHLAGEAYVDIYYVGAGHALNAFNRGYVLAISDLSPPDADWRNAQLYAWPGVEFEGNVLGLTRPLPVMNQPGIFVNLDLINALGLPNPVDLIARGEWTWDAMREIMAGGTTGEFYGASGLLGNAMTHLIMANDGFIVNPDTLEIGHDDPAALAAIELIQEIIDNGWFMIGDRGIDNYFTAGAANNAIFMYGRSVLHFSANATNLTAARNAGGGTFPMSYDFIAYPMGPNNTSGATHHHVGRNNEGIVAGTEIDPEILMWILEELKMFTGEDYYREHEGDHDWGRGWLPNEDAVLRLAANGITGRVIDLGALTGVVGGGFHDTLVRALYANTMTIAQYIEYHRADRNYALTTWFGR